MTTEPNMCSECNTLNDCFECVLGAVLITNGQTKFCVNSEQSLLPNAGDLGEGTPDENTPTTEWANGPYPSTWLSDPTDPTSPVVTEVWYISEPVKAFDINAITGRHDDDNNGVELLEEDQMQSVTCEPGYTVLTGDDMCSPCETDEENECYACVDATQNQCTECDLNHVLLLSADTTTYTNCKNPVSDSNDPALYTQEEADERVPEGQWA